MDMCLRQIGVSLAALAFALCGAVSAQAKLSAWNEGQLYFFEQVGAGTPTEGWGPYWNHTSGTDQEWTVSYAGKSYGFSGTVEFGMSDITDNASPYDLGWFSTYYQFGQLATLSLGRLRMYDYILPSDIEGLKIGAFADKQFGAALQVTPIQGLSLGVFAQVPTSGIYAETNTVSAPWSDISSAAPIDYLDNLVGGASWALPGIGTFMAQYSAIAKALNIGARATFGKVHAQIEYQYSDLISASHEAVASVGATIGGILLDSDLGVMYTSSTLALAGEIQAEYDLSQWAFGLLAGYDDGKGIQLFDVAQGAWDGLELYPYIACNFDNGSSVKLGIVYASGANGHASLYALPLTYVWAF